MSLKAYLRISPLIDEHKAHYSDGEFRAFMHVLAAAGRQPTRGRFHSLAQLRALLGRHARYVPTLIAEGDIEPTDDGGVYVCGWDEWQEGDLTVGDRMKKLRDKRRNGSA